MMRRLAGATPGIVRKTLKLYFCLYFLHAAHAPAAAAQQQADSDRVCRQAAQFFGETAHANAHARVRGGELYERRRMAQAQLLSCGATGGEVAGATIRALRMESDTAILSADVAPFAHFRDASVFTAAIDVAADRGASDAARLFAVRTLWVQKTGKYWLGVDQLTPEPEFDPAHPWALCGKYKHYTDATPYWSSGRALPADYVVQIADLARRIRGLAAEPIAVRTAVSCLLLD